MFVAPAPTIDTDDAVPDLVRAIGQFGVALTTVGAQSATNIVISPFSVAVALQMAWQGAAGETADETATVLRVGDSVRTAYTQRHLTSIVQANLPADAVTLLIANTMWVQTGLRLRPSFSEKLRTAYDAELSSVDFVGQPEICRDEINRRVAQQTDDRVTNLLQPGTLDTDTRLVLANATYLKLHWGESFPPEATTEETFHLPTGDTAQVPMMHHKAKFGYTRRDGYQAVSMSDSTGQLAMTVLLPDGPVTQLEERLRHQDLNTVLTDLRSVELTLAMPRFHYRGNHPLGSHLRTLGIRRAFDELRADFTGITPDERLYISHVAHGVDLTVDEQGAEAAAASAVVVTSISMPMSPPTVTIDRPFLFVVTHTGTGLPLLFGRVSDPSHMVG